MALQGEQQDPEGEEQLQQQELQQQQLDQTTPTSAENIMQASSPEKAAWPRRQGSVQAAQGWENGVPRELDSASGHSLATGGGDVPQAQAWVSSSPSAPHPAPHSAAASVAATCSAAQGFGGGGRGWDSASRPRSAPLRREGGCATGRGQAPAWLGSGMAGAGPRTAAAASSKLAAAWAEVDWMHRCLAERERELCQREVAARRADARNRATARQLTELRRRLDDYGQELEQGVLALAAQQRTLKEERRQAAEIQAHARQVCGAASRSDGGGTAMSVSGRLRDHRERRPWTPMSTTT